MAGQPAKATGVASSTLLQMPTQASQMWTLGPAISRVTSLSDLPQNEHFSFRLRLIAIMAAAFCQGDLDNSDARARVKEALTPRSVMQSRINPIKYYKRRDYIWI